eukprot:SAG22_NODE_403_length_11012_cov_12.141024_7_plen_118_part_00
MASTGTGEFVVVCTGAPHRGMGWYHSQQLLAGEVPGAKLTAVVEPWFLGGGADGEHSAAFKAFRAEAEGMHGVQVGARERGREGAAHHAYTRAGRPAPLEAGENPTHLIGHSRVTAC